MRQNRSLAALAQDWTRHDLDEAAVRELDDLRRHPGTLGRAPTVWFARVLLFTVAVRVVSPVSLVLVLVLFVNPSNALDIAGGLVLLAIAVVSRPKSARSFEIVARLTAKDAPRLFDLLDQTRRAVGAPGCTSFGWEPAPPR